MIAPPIEPLHTIHQRRDRAISMVDTPPKPPMKEPPSPPNEPPIEEPDRPPEGPFPPAHPPVEEPPNAPQKQPVQEPPRKAPGQASTHGWRGHSRTWPIRNPITPKFSHQPIACPRPCSTPFIAPSGQVLKLTSSFVTPVSGAPVNPYFLKRNYAEHPIPAWGAMR